MAEPLTVTVSLQPRDVKQIAMVTYESCRALRASFGDIAHPVWRQCSSGQQHDIEVIVRRIATGAIQTPSQIHQQWRDEAVRAGVKRLERLEDAGKPGFSPDICDWAELPPETQTVFGLMFAVASSLLQHVGLIVLHRQLKMRKT